ncbi:hypothetical protein NC652_032824 [Populus alba x Populus x berolinensis]|nr:hypothetical protein NC652_032824 [Populus alba x Populus x berolinensis]
MEYLQPNEVKSEGSKVRGVEFIADLNRRNLGIKFIVQGQINEQESFLKNSLSSPPLHLARFSGSLSSPLTHSFGNFILWNKIISKYVKQFLGSLFSLRPAT